MSTDPATRITARQRLAQTRAEIIDAIVPGIEFDAVDPSSAGARAAQAAAQEAAEQRAIHARLVAQRHAAAQREAVADWVADNAADASAAATHAARAARSTRRATAAPSFGWRPLLRRGASIWWRNHPAHAAFEVLDSALSHVACRKPYLMLGVAAGTGALLVVVRPWRLVSLTGLVLALARTTDVRSLMGSLLRGD